MLRKIFTINVTHELLAADAIRPWEIIILTAGSRMLPGTMVLEY